MPVPAISWEYLIVDNRNTGEQNKQLALTNITAILYNKTVMITIIEMETIWQLTSAADSVKKSGTI